MSGTILRVLPRTRYDFANVSENTSVIVWLQQNIDVSRWEEATLLVRVHQLSLATGASFTIDVFGVLPSPEDPAQYFRSGTTLASIPIDGTSAAPSLIAAPFSSSFGAFVSISLTASQPETDPGALAAILSMDLSGKA